MKKEQKLSSPMQKDTRVNRREFIQRTSAGVAGAALLQWGGETPLHAQSNSQAKWAWPRALAVPGVHAYSLEKSVAAGETLEFCVSSSVPYQLSICRLGSEMDQPDKDDVLHVFPRSLATPQPIHPGSFILVESNLSGSLPGLALECWVRPRKTDVWSGLITQFDHPNDCGYGLFLNPQGGVNFYFGQRSEFHVDYSHDTNAGIIKPNEWHHIVASWDGEKAVVWVNGKQEGTWNWFGVGMSVATGNAPIRLGAGAEGGATMRILDGDLAMPVIYKRGLTEAEVRQRLAQRGLQPTNERHVYACWPLHEERGDRVEDVSEYHRQGRIVNHGTWMIGGPSYDADVPRFGNYDPLKDRKRGHAIRLASDDLYDCGWEVTHQFEIPESAKPGIYVGRIAYELDGVARLYHATFVVRKHRKRKPAPLLVLCASNTWLAYNGTPFGVDSPELKEVWGTNGTGNSPGNPPAFNLYRPHAAGQGTYQMGLRMPWPAAGPYVLYGEKTDYSHLMRADRFAHAWLEKAGYDFDVVTDLDLHRDPGLLRDYQALVINGHSEYWSIPMYDGLKEYLSKGGNVVCLSGNSLFWRVSFNEAGTIMECRKVDAPGNQTEPKFRGECWHSDDGRRGGLMRECGYPGWKLVGLETLGWNNQGDPKQFGAYHVDLPDHLLFQHPHPVEVAKGDPIGQAPDGGLPRANGHEIDVRLSTLRELQTEPAPPGGVLPEDPQGIVRLANGVIPWKEGGAAFDYFFRAVKPAHDQGGEMIYWERPAGGRVFNAGSIGSGWALHADPKFQNLVKNVLAHFGVTA